MYTKKNVRLDSRKKFCFISILINVNWTTQWHNTQKVEAGVVRIILSSSSGSLEKIKMLLNAAKLISKHQHC
jgi:hypothetical protein